MNFIKHLGNGQFHKSAIVLYRNWVETVIGKPVVVCLTLIVIREPAHRLSESSWYLAVSKTNKS